MESSTVERHPAGLGLTILGAILAAAGCATGSPQTGSYDIPTDSRSAGAFQSWFEGEEGVSDLRDEEMKRDVGVDRQFAAAEIAYWAGDVERSFEGYLRMIRTDPSHPLNRFAAARLYDLRDEISSYRERITPALEKARYSEFEPLARVYLSLCGQTVAFRRWNNSETEEPFRADALGFSTAWRVTPRLSPWRALDFDRSFAVGQHDSLRDRYLSPWFAEDRSINRDRTTPYRTDGRSISPSLGGSGIYYLETFATVEAPDEGGSREFWLYGNFSGAARVWMDGRRVLEREQGIYGSGKRLRRVELGAGTHRIRIKLGYAPGVGDWYDLAFLADSGSVLEGSGLSFSKEAPERFSPSTAQLQVGDAQRTPAELEPALVPADEVEGASDTALYLTMSASYYSGHPEYFEAAWRAFTDRHPDFAPAHGVKAAQVRTLEAVPPEKRRARALSHLREAISSADRSIRFPLRLGRELSRRNSDSKEARRLLEQARERAADGSPESGRLRNREAFEAWAAYLEGRGWEERAEPAWERALEADPTNCRAARSLQTIWAGRSHYPPLEEITPEWERCPAVERSRVFARPDRREERLRYYRREANRHPYRAGPQIDYADELRKQGHGEEARKVIRRARDRIPWSSSIRIEIAENRFADEGREAAVRVLERAIEENGASAKIDRRLANLRNEEPLEALVRDGRRAAMDHLRSLSDADRAHPAARSSDEAYYLVDYAAREYAENGSSKTLTHTVVRVMTKGAIDRFGEKSIPGNARLLRARTINEDGSVEIPERSAGKSTLSMPGLDPGDFVEFAYVQYGPPSLKANSHLDGLQFYFRMSDISSLHSEYAIFGADGAKFIRENDPPEAAAYEKRGYEGVHFLREESPRPRKEPYTPNGSEYLPWIQLYRSGFDLDPFDVDRRYVADRIMNSLETSAELESTVDGWREGVEPDTVEEIRQLFYHVTERVKNPNPDNFSRDASHVLAANRGSPHVLLQAVYRAAGIDSELYVVKSEYEHPEEFPVGEFAKYHRPLVRVELPDGEVAWLNPSSPDAMFRAVNLSTMGQPGVCLTCETWVERRVPEDGFRRTEREVAVKGALDETGTMTGTAEVTFHGIRAVSVRSTLRETPETEDRRKFFDRVVNNLVPGSSIVDFDISHERKRDRPLNVQIEFERPNFARSSSGGTMRIQAPLFREPVASRYAELEKRERPLMIPRQRETNYSLELDLPEGFRPTLESRSGDWELDSRWGAFRRTVKIAGGTLEVESSLVLPIQRISTDRYSDFQRWAYGVERSSRLVLTLETSDR